MHRDSSACPHSLNACLLRLKHCFVGGALLCAGFAQVDRTGHI